MSVDPELLSDLRNCNRSQTAALLEELYDSLAQLVRAVNTSELAAAMACHEIVAFANVEDALNLALPALAKARGESVND